MPVLLLAKFRYLGYPAALGGAGHETGREQCLYKTIPASAWIQIKVTVFSVPVQLNGHFLAVYMSAYGSVEEVTTVHSADETAHSNFVQNIYLNREGFQAIPHILTYKDQQMMAVVDGRMPPCFLQTTRNCPQKSTINRSQTSKLWIQTG